MTVLPIVERELRGTSRRRGTYRLRWIVALAAILMGGYFYLANWNGPPSEMGKSIFQGISGLALVYCLAAGRLYTADSLSEEKREGTLGLLFLTDLTGYDVVFGKLAATSLSGLYGLLAILPVMAVPLLMGGVTSGEFWRAALVLVDAILLSLAIGIFSSVLARNAARAMGANFFLLFLLVGGLPACGGLVYGYGSYRYIPALFYTCPVYPFILCEFGFYNSYTVDFWSSLAVIHVITWVLVALASWWAPHSWQDAAHGVRVMSWRDRWHDWVFGNAAQRKALRRQLLEANPFCWLASRARLKPIGVWLFLAFLGVWWLFVWLRLGFQWYEESFLVITVIMLNSVLKLWVGIEAGQRLAEDQRMGSLELLLSTPLGVKDILRGQWLALRRQFLWPVVAAALLQLLLLVCASQKIYRTDSRVMAFAGTCLLLLVVDLLAVAWTSLASALTAKSANHANLSSITRVFLAPMAIWTAFAFLAEMTPGNDFSWRFYLYWWLVLSLLADLAFGLRGWRRANTQFRQLALRRFAPKAARE